jgi:hypothetical protein
MFFIIWGSRTIVLTIGAGTFFCPKCRVTQTFSHKQQKRFFTLYYIPIFPIGDGQHYVECQHCHGTFTPEVLRMPSLQVTYQQRHPLRNAYGLVAAAIIALMVFGNVQSGIVARQAEEASIAAYNTKVAYVANFGQANLDLCKSAKKTSSWTIPSDAHVLIFNNEAQEVANSYQNQLSAEHRASSQQDLTHIVCITPSMLEYEHADYGEDKSDVVVYTCTSYVRFFETYVVDVKTRKTIAYHRFLGSKPAKCPDQVKGNQAFYGDNPTPAQIAEGLNTNSGNPT